MLQSQRKTSPLASSQDSEVKWVIVSLSSNGERETNINAIKKSAQRIIKNVNVDVFVPAISQLVRGESETMFYMQGYIFIKFQENIHYLKLRETTYFNDVLCSLVNRKIQYHLLDDSELKKIRQEVNNLKFSEFEVGDAVTVIKGNFKNLPGIISTVYDEEQIQVSVTLRSKSLLIDFPSTYLKKK